MTKENFIRYLSCCRSLEEGNILSALFNKLSQEHLFAVFSSNSSLSSNSFWSYHIS